MGKQGTSGHNSRDYFIYSTNRKTFIISKYRGSIQGYQEREYKHIKTAQATCGIILAPQILVFPANVDH